jgi:hypothetical protein
MTSPQEQHAGSGDSVDELRARADWHRAMAEVAGRAAGMVEALRADLATHGITVSAEIDAGGVTLSLDCPSPPWDQAEVTLRAVPVEPPSNAALARLANAAVVQLAARRVAVIQEAAAAEAAVESPDPARLEAEVRRVVADEAPQDTLARAHQEQAEARQDLLIAGLDALPRRPKWSAERDYELLDAICHGTPVGDAAAYLRLPVSSVHERMADLQRLADSLGEDWQGGITEVRDAARIRAQRARSA